MIRRGYSHLNLTYRFLPFERLVSLSSNRLVLWSLFIDITDTTYSLYFSLSLKIDFSELHTEPCTSNFLISSFFFQNQKNSFYKPKNYTKLQYVKQVKPNHCGWVRAGRSLDIHPSVLLLPRFPLCYCCPPTS